MRKQETRFEVYKMIYSLLYFISLVVFMDTNDIMVNELNMDNVGTLIKEFHF